MRGGERSDGRRLPHLHRDRETREVHVILRGPESLQYPTRKEFQHLAEIMHELQKVDNKTHLPSLASLVGRMIPHQYAACGTFLPAKHQLMIGHTNYNSELHHLYVTQGFVTDPSIQLLQRTKIGTVTSEDNPAVVIPREVTSLKLDFGIKACLSTGVRGVLGQCTYFLFSNFDQKLILKLRTIMQILAPHFHLAYLRATTPQEEEPNVPKWSTLTPREHEIMRWVAEGKTNWEISVILKVSLNTVKFHLKNVYQKLGGVENRWSAIAQWQSGAAALVQARTDPSEH